MKRILTILLAGASTLAIAQKKTSHSQVLPAPTAPAAPSAPVAPHAPVLYSSADAKAHIWISDNEDQHHATITGDNGYSKQVRFNKESGELFLQYKFSKRNEEFIYEKTVNAAEKSEEERQQIIDHFEIEIELPGRGI